MWGQITRGQSEVVFAVEKGWDPYGMVACRGESKHKGQAVVEAKQGQGKIKAEQ